MAVATVIEEQKDKIDKTALITGSEAIAVACQLADVDVITAYPDPSLRHRHAVRLQAGGER